MIHSYGEQWSSGVLWAERVRFAFYPLNKFFTGVDLDTFERTVGPMLPSPQGLGFPPVTGRLGMKVEGGGKRRKNRRRREMGFIPSKQ